MGERVARSRRRHAEALQMGGQQAVSRHRASGRLPVRERVALLFDEGSGYQTGVLAQPERRTEKKVPGDGVVTGFGRMDGRTVGLTGIDATALAGTTAPVSMRKQGRVIEQAQRLGVQGPRAERQAGRGGGPRVPGTAVGQPRKDTFADLAAEHRGPGRDRTEDQL
jgi:acetyl-CoA carboxylase carboxyltransferase component